MDINTLIVPLAISLLIGGLIIFYFSRRFVAIDQKTTAMLQVVQALSRDNEQRKILDNYTRQQIVQEQQLQSEQQTGGEEQELINVSDNGNHSDVDTDSESVDDSSDEESDDSSDEE